eukprot:5855488-Alexandrium_andersonii.AAC.1
MVAELIVGPTEGAAGDQNAPEEQTLHNEDQPEQDPEVQIIEPRLAYRLDVDNRWIGNLIRRACDTQASVGEQPRVNPPAQGQGEPGDPHPTTSSTTTSSKLTFSGSRERIDSP